MEDYCEWLCLKPAVPIVEDIIAEVPRLVDGGGRVLLLSDVHANWLALVEVLRHAAQRGYEALWFLGDMAGYGPRPLECLAFLRQCIAPAGQWVVGNHEMGLMGQEAPPESGFGVSERARRSWRVQRRELQDDPPLWSWCRTRLAPELTHPFEAKFDSYHRVMVHSNLGDYIWNNLYPDDEFNLAEQLQPLEKRVGRDTTAVWLLVGHTHMVTVARLEGPTSLHYLPITYGTPISVAQGVFLLNPGSVGQPRDGDPRASYALLDLGKGTITFHRVTYDTSAVQIEMQEHGYPATLIELLDSARIRATLNFDRVYKREGSQGILPRSGYR